MFDICNSAAVSWNQVKWNNWTLGFPHFLWMSCESQPPPISSPICKTSYRHSTTHLEEEREDESTLDASLSFEFYLHFIGFCFRTRSSLLRENSIIVFITQLGAQHMLNFNFKLQLRQTHTHKQQNKKKKYPIKIS